MKKLRVFVLAGFVWGGAVEMDCYRKGDIERDREKAMEKRGRGISTGDYREGQYPPVSEKEIEKCVRKCVRTKQDEKMGYAPGSSMDGIEGPRKRKDRRKGFPQTRGDYSQPGNYFPQMQPDYPQGPSRFDGSVGRPQNPFQPSVDPVGRPQKRKCFPVGGVPPYGQFPAEDPAQTLPERPIQTMPERPIQTLPGGPIQTLPERPIQTMPERPVQTMPERPIQTLPGGPIQTLPGSNIPEKGKYPSVPPPKIVCKPVDKKMMYKMKKVLEDKMEKFQKDVFKYTKRQLKKLKREQKREKRKEAMEIMKKKEDVLKRKIERMENGLEAKKVVCTRKKTLSRKNKLEKKKKKCEKGKILLHRIDKSIEELERETSPKHGACSGSSLF
ncbi:MAG: uncharacterized protein A8A55_0126 [Amphiamblys sp. WSBS2006]|nr:MAG: uncharacterized protein A8A55_0126 [Amphiamblys sp. WSBS2006]